MLITMSFAKAGAGAMAAPVSMLAAESAAIDVFSLP